jgi:hypothetical protein
MGCAKPNPDKVQMADTTESITIEHLPNVQEDTLSYIGYIRKFDDNNSFYTDLYFVDNFNYDLYNEISKMGDQVIFQGDENKRTRMEINRVGQYFNLTGLKNVDIYSKENVKLTSARLSHIEYVEDVLESRFVAVFKVDDPSISDPLFCVGNSIKDFTKIDFTSHDDEKLKLELIELLKLDSQHIWNIQHYKLDTHTIYSTVSTDTTAYIIETMNNTHTTLYKSKSSEAINGLDLISKKINGRPILLTESGLPETDMMWTSVLIFNGTDYEASRDHRISGQ